MNVRDRSRGAKKYRPYRSSDKDMQSTSSSIMRGTRLFRGGVITDLVLLAVFIILAYVFISRRSNVETLNDALPKVISKSGAGKEGNSHHMIDARVKKIPDFRSDECKTKRYSRQNPVTIVIVFFDYSFHDMKQTLSSILLNTPDELIQEILVVDDASTLGYIVDKAKDYIKTIKKARFIRNDKQLYRSGSRMQGLKLAKTNIVVFIEPNTIVARGWMEPLVDHLQQHPQTIAVPHFDSISDPVSYEYKGTNNALVTGISWSLAVRMRQTTHRINDRTAPIDTPAIRGNVLAVSKPEFLKLGGYDEGFHDGGGPDLELSLRSWLCGYKIQVVPCSRIGIINLQDPVKIVSPINIRRVAEMWFSGRKNLIYRNTAVTESMTDMEKKSFKDRKTQLDGLNLKCQDIEWFFQNVAGHLPTPSEKAVKFGLLKCNTGRCAYAAADNRLELNPCKSEHYSSPIPKMVFELTEDDMLTTNGQCLGVLQTAYIVLEDCRHNDTHQKWQHKDNRLVNTWSTYCMMHVTDPDKTTGGKRQIAMAQECSSTKEPHFNSFDFVQL